MSDSGHELRENNEKIVKLMSILKKQRNEMNYLIEKQKEEKNRIQNEIEKLTFKLSLLTKSLGQRVQAKSNYDKTIKEIEENYSSLVEESGKLLSTITKEVHELEEIMDKKIGTEQEKRRSLEEEAREKSGEALEKSEEALEKAEERSHDSPTNGSAVLEGEDDEQLEGEQETYDEISQDKSEEEMEKKSSPSKIDKPPPIKSLSNGVKNFKNSIDVELQSYREAYGRQHTSASPPHSINGAAGNSKRDSVPSKASRRKSGPR
ncbi:cilia- and flagella-associated protein 251-like [Tribolium madens]|uniref:cilia- and flagella-associated protein 251-like n=1 Tax=Tribolium madens TaxID=41895 RepID=UPI001CF72FBC|nr:cilia- and flagella-associated protein 251-like [Tribolium madens]